MNKPFHLKTMLAVTLAVVALGSISRAQDQTMPPPASGAELPSDIVPNTPLAQVVKLVQSGVPVNVIENFVANSQGPFELDVDKISTLNDLGVPKEVINAMLVRDKALYAATATPPPTEPATTTAPDTSTAPPTEEVTVNYFDETLTPYGSWVNVDGYGRCWRPTTVIYDSGWQPYCDRGHWVYTDCGWYWDSDYSWGVTFHYGRWFRHARYGWCWYPDTQWAPSWVTWRESDNFRGWAPLPPLAVFRPGIGFQYRGVNVGVDFDFGLDVNCFTFVAPDHFCDFHPRRFRVAPAHVPDFFSHSRVINDFSHHDRVFVNNGIPVSQVRARDNHPIQAVKVDSLPRAARQGWRGNDGGGANSHFVPTNKNGNNNYNNSTIHNTIIDNSQRNNNPANNPAGHDRGNNNSSGQPVNHQVGSPYVPPHQPTPGSQGNQNQGNHNDQRDHSSVNLPNTKPTQVVGQAQSNPGNGQHAPAAGSANVILSGQSQWQNSGSHNSSSSGTYVHPATSLTQQRMTFSAQPPVVTQHSAPQRSVEIPAHLGPQMEQPAPHPVQVQQVQHSSPPATAPVPAANQSHDSGHSAGNNKRDH